MWVKEAISDGEIDALRQAAQRAWDDDTAYRLWRGHPGVGCGQCYVTSAWLVTRLGGHVGRRAGHYVWLSPDRSFYIDLTGDHNGAPVYARNEDFQAVEYADTERSKKFVRRANRIFDGLTKLADFETGGDAYPAEEPERAEMIDQETGPYWHDEPQADSANGNYHFVYANGQLEISPMHGHDELAEHAGVDLQHNGPMAVGYVTVTNGKATWDVQANMNIRGLFRIFKDATKHYGWTWGGLCNVDGEPISDDFAPRGAYTLSYVYAKDHLYIGRCTRSELFLEAGVKADGASGGRIYINGQDAFVTPVLAKTLPALYEWATDQGLRLYALNDNQLKRIPDLEVKDNYSPDPQESPQTNPSGYQDEREPSGLYKCPACQRLFPNWHEYSKHRRDEEPWGDEVEIANAGGPESDLDSTFPTHFTEQQPFVMPVASIREATRVDGFKGGSEDDEYYVAYQYGCPVGYARLSEGKLADLVAHRDSEPYILSAVQHYTVQSPSQMLPGPVPFIYDIDKDSVTVGNPGARTADIPGQFTPGGIIEGRYEPGGKIIIRTMTNMPYSVRHMVELWYYSHPELEVKTVYLEDDAGGTTKLAADNNVGAYISAMVAADPAAHAASQALLAAGGRPFAVGGAVRDAVIGNEPKDIDLMVSGLPAEQVQEVLSKLPGRVDYTGKDFGVFRYKFAGHDVEIALPRRERSTGAGHQDFDVQADHTMKPEEDLERRDFTANSMAVDLSNGHFIDPFNGSHDIAHGILRTVNDEAFSEDPLRLVRALVAHARHGLEPDEATRVQMQTNAEALHHLPPERIQAELDKLFAAKNPAKAIRLAHDTGVLKHFLPEVDSAFGYNQNNPHHELELGDHLVNVLSRLGEKSTDRDLRLAGLLHDIGKPASAWVDPETGSNHYYEKRMPDGTMLGANHEDVGAEMTKQIMSRLRYPNDRIKRVSDLVQHHMYDHFTTPRGARRFLARVNGHANDLLTLRWADQGGKSVYPTDPNASLDQERNLIDQVRNEGQATSQAQLAINGNDLIQMGIPQGPQIGSILRELTEQVIENPELNTRDALLTLAGQYARIEQ